MGNLKIIMYSFIYIGVVISLATLISKKNGSSEVSRKLVHILVGNWVFFTPFFTEFWAVIFVPFVFIIINSLSIQYNLISAIERNDDSLGTVYYAISLLILSGAGFLLEWSILPFIGILTMAYGDGFAAVVGKKWGKRYPFKFAPKKTLEGSLTVAFFAFLVTLGSILVFQRVGEFQNISLLMAGFISLLTAVFSSFIELTGKKGCDNLILPIGSGLFATFLLKFNSLGLFVYLLVATIILLAAYRYGSITEDGMVAAELTAITLYTLGGAWLGISLLVFFVLGSLVSKIKNKNKIEAESLQDDEEARNWRQVLSNSLPACIIAWVYYMVPGKEIILLPAFAMFSAAAADTFSSELGMLSKGRTFNILTGKTMASGLSGGVTWLGLLSGLLGSSILSFFALPQFGPKGMFYVFILGFLGTIFDSVIGIALQSKYLGKDGVLQDKAMNIYDKPIKGLKAITNNAVNFITLSLVTIVGQLFCLLPLI